jgi:Zn-dependent protease
MLAAALVGALSMHEYAHALAADLQGDRLPRAMGRLSLNPMRHLDPMGTIAIVLVGFGWAKPVEFRMEALSSKRFGAAIVALAGPLMNLILAFVGGFLFGLVQGTDAPRSLFLFLFSFTYINVLLAVFNLIPLPPLDGSRLLTIFLPPDRQKIIFFLDRYGFLILLALVFLAGEWLFDKIEPVQRFILELAGVDLPDSGI